MEWLSRALGVFRELGDKARQAETLVDIGVVHWYQGDFDSALQNYDQAREVGRQIDDPIIVIRATGNRGLVLWNQGKIDEALADYLACQAQSDALGDKKGVSTAAGNIGNIYLDQGRYPEALASHRISFQLAMEIGFLPIASIGVGNMGEIYFYQGEYQNALSCYLYNLRIGLEIGDRLGISFALYNIARVYTDQKNFAIAQRIIENAIHIAREIEVPFELCDYLVLELELKLNGEQYERARTISKEILERAPQVSHHSALVAAKRANISLQHRIGQITNKEAAQLYRELLDEEDDPSVRAVIQYDISKVDNRDIKIIEEAAEYYRKEYETTPNIRYRRRYETLTGKRLALPEKLPDIPEVVTRQALSLENLLQQVEKS
jgi:tetratricopeptide (TPR) repeat protein